MRPKANFKLFIVFIVVSVFFTIWLTYNGYFNKEFIERNSDDNGVPNGTLLFHVWAPLIFAGLAALIGPCLKEFLGIKGFLGARVRARELEREQAREQARELEREQARELQRAKERLLRCPKCKGTLPFPKCACPLCGDSPRARTIRHVLITCVCILLALPTASIIGFTALCCRHISSTCLQSIGLVGEGALEDGITTRTYPHPSGDTTVVTTWDPADYFVACALRLFLLLFILIGIVLPYGIFPFLLVYVQFNLEDLHTRYFVLVRRLIPRFYVPGELIPTPAKCLTVSFQLVLFAVCTVLPTLIFFFGKLIWVLQGISYLLGRGRELYT